jgi:hypothetical protein
MSKFKEGDRVECLVDHPDGNHTLLMGSIGTVKRIYTRGDYGRIGVEWDVEVEEGHDLSGACKDRYGWNVNAKEVKLIPSKKIIVEEEVVTGRRIKIKSKEKVC